MREPSYPVSFRVEESLSWIIDKIDEMAKKKGVNRSDIIKEALKEYIKIR